MQEFMASGMPWKIFNFLLFAGGLFFALRRSVSEFWQGRSESMTFEIEEATRLRKEAGKKVYDLEMRLSRLDQETTDLVKRFREDGELEKREIIHNAARLVEQLRGDSQRIMEQELGRVREELRRQVTEISISIAERLFREKLGVADQRRLNENYLEELEARI